MKKSLFTTSIAVISALYVGGAFATDYGNISSGIINDLFTNDTIGTLGGTAKLVNMHGGDITMVTSNAKADYTVENMTDGTIGTVSYAKLGAITGGNINLIRNYSNVDTFSATLQTLEGGSKITDMTGGSINLVNGANTGVEHIKGGRIETMTDSAYGRLEGGEIGTLSNNANLYWFSSGTIDNVDGGKIGGGSNGLIKKLTTGTITGTLGSGIEIREMLDGTVATLNGFFGTISGGTITTLTSNKQSGTISGGEITNANGGVQIDTVTGSGLVKFLDGGSKIEYVKGGTVDTIGQANDARSGVGNLQDAGTVNYLKNNSYIGALRNGGTLVNMMDTSQIYWMGGGTITNMTGGTVDAMAGGTITNMSDGTITSMTNGTVSNMTGGTIAAINGGTVTNVGAAAIINNISKIKINGTVDAGQTIDVSNGGIADLNATTSGTAFNRDISTGSNANIIIRNYDFASGTTVSIGNGSELHIGDTTIDKLSMNNGNIFVGAAGSANGGNATINDLSANGKINVNFFVDTVLGAPNDMLTINGNSGSVSKHGLSVANHNFGTDYTEQIDLINDETGSLQFGLTHGRYVGIGAKNYGLRSNDNGNGGLMWSLILKEALGLSDGAIVIGSVPTANLAVLQGMNNSTYSRMVDLRHQYTQGAWVRTFAQQTQFKSLTDVDVMHYGAEGGYDFEIAHFWTGRLSGGFGFGYARSDADVDTFETKNGGADSNMYSVNVYLSYLLQSGFYFDAMAGYTHFDTDAYFYDNADIKNEFDFNQNAYTASAAIGWQIPVTNSFTLDPQVRATYINLHGAGFADPEGYAGNYDRTDSLLGTASLAMKYKIGSYEPYLRVAYHHEFEGETQITYDDTIYKSALGGNRGEAAIGITGKIAPSTSIYAEGAFQSGENDWTSYGGNIGIRMNF